jgi:BON domain
LTQKDQASRNEGWFSGYDGKNVKIIAQNGKVSLKGPVNSQQEKDTIPAKAGEIAGTALCLVDTESQADAIVEKLRSAGFSDNDISVFPDKGSTRDFAHKKETKMPEAATLGAGTGNENGFHCFTPRSKTTKSFYALDREN